MSQIDPTKKPFSDSDNCCTPRLAGKTLVARLKSTT